MKYFTCLDKVDFNAGCACAFADITDEWILTATNVPPTAGFSRYGNIEVELNLPACKHDEVALVRKPIQGGTFYVDHDVVCGFCKGSSVTMDNTVELLVSTMRNLGANVEKTGNDITLGGKKIAGIGVAYFSDTPICGFVINVSAQPEPFAKYFNPPADKIDKHGADYFETRVGRLSEATPRITPKILADALVAEFGGTVERTFKEVMKNSTARKYKKALGSRAWIYYGVLPWEVHKVQKIMFANEKTLAVSNVHGNTIEGREVLTFVFPEQDVTFSQLLAIANDPVVTKTITVISEDVTGEEPPQYNAQIGFTDLIDLSYSSGQFQLSLGKHA